MEGRSLKIYLLVSGNEVPDSLMGRLLKTKGLCDPKTFSKITGNTEFLTA